MIAVSSESSGMSEEDLARTNLRMDTTFIRELTVLVMENGGSVGVRVDDVVRGDTLV